MRKTKLYLAAFLYVAVGFVHAAEPVKLGASLDLSGPAASLGQDALTGAQLAVTNLNEHGGVLGRPVQLNYEDNGTNPQRAVNQSIELVQRGASALLSPISSAGTLAVSREVSKRSKVPMCVSISSSDQITGKQFQPYVYSVMPTLAMQQRAVTAWLAKQPGNRYAIIAADYVGGRDAVDWFKKFIKEQNPKAEIVAEEYPKLGATDYTATINKVMASKPDFVWGQIYGSDVLTFVRQANSLGFFKKSGEKLITIVDPNILKQLGKDAPDGMLAYELAPFSYLMTTGENRDVGPWITNYKNRYEAWPSDWVMLGYDCVMAWAQAVKFANSTDADAVMHAIETNEFHSLRGRFRFAKYDHEGLLPVYVGQVKREGPYGQPYLNVEMAMPGTDSHLSESAVMQARGSD
jgi:branched-chain amino acid transport system substrate-binding protein